MRRLRTKTGRAADASPPPAFAPLEEDIAGRLARLEEKRGSRPPAPGGCPRPEPFERILRDFVSGISGMKGKPPS